MSYDSHNEPLGYNKRNREFSGTVYFFSSFDIGEEIDLKEIPSAYLSSRKKSFQSELFKSYHRPIVLDTDRCDLSVYCDDVHLYNFGVISLRYRFPFTASLERLKKIIHDFDALYEEKVKEDAHAVFKKIYGAIRHPRFFHLNTSYTVVQIDTQHSLDAYAFKEHYATEVAMVLRFEHEHLSEYKKQEILSNALGYYRGELLIIDYDTALIYDSDYTDLLDIFEFTNVRSMELQYFDRTLDKQLNLAYERQPYKIPWQAYIPLFGMLRFDPVGELAKLKVDISVISERLFSSIKFSDEPYYKEVYQALSEKLDFKTWQSSLDKKLEIIHDILEVHQNRVASVRYDMLNMLIVILIFMELLIAFLGYLNK